MKYLRIVLQLNVLTFLDCSVMRQLVFGHRYFLTCSSANQMPSLGFTEASSGDGGPDETGFTPH